MNTCHVFLIISLVSLGGSVSGLCNEDYIFGIYQKACRKFRRSNFVKNPFRRPLSKHDFKDIMMMNDWRNSDAEIMDILWNDEMKEAVRDRWLPFKAVRARRDADKYNDDFLNEVHGPKIMMNKDFWKSLLTGTSPDVPRSRITKSTFRLVKKCCNSGCDESDFRPWC